MRRSLLLLPLCSVVLLVAGCGNKGPLYLPKPTPAPATAPVQPAAPAATPAPMAAPAAPAVVHGFVTDLKAFTAFIDSHPTPEQFHTTYPDVLLITPGMVSTRELRNTNSRYFADLDKDGRITGGKFM